MTTDGTGYYWLYDGTSSTTNGNTFTTNYTINYPLGNPSDDLISSPVQDTKDKKMEKSKHNVAHEGWGWPSDSEVAHWFQSFGLSLCKKWSYLGDRSLLDSKNPLRESPDNCTDCFMVLKYLGVV